MRRGFQCSSPLCLSKEIRVLWAPTPIAYCAQFHHSPKRIASVCRSSPIRPRSIPNNCATMGAALFGERQTLEQVVAAQKELLSEAADEAFFECDRLADRAREMMRRLRNEVKNGSHQAVLLQMSRLVVQTNRQRASLLAKVHTLNQLGSLMDSLETKATVQQTMIKANGIMGQLNRALPVSSLGNLQKSFAMNLEMLDMKSETLNDLLGDSLETEDDLTDEVDDAANTLLSSVQEEHDQSVLLESLPSTSSTTTAPQIHRRAALRGGVENKK